MLGNVDEFKPGFRIVEPEKNWALIAYAIGLCEKYQLQPGKIISRVHQPRAPHPSGTVREWEITFDELQSYRRKIEHALNYPDDSLHTGDHCAKCPSMMTCPASRAASFNAIDVSTIAHAETIGDEIVAAELQIVQDAEKRIKIRKKQLEDLATYRIKQGSVIEGFSVEQSYGNLAWNNGLQPEFISAMTGVDCTRVDAITPTQAIAKGANETVVKSLASRAETGFKLNRISANKRAEKLFGKVK